MHPIKSLGNFFKRETPAATVGKIFDPGAAIGDLSQVVGWHSMGGGTYDAYKRNDLENGYPSIHLIADNFASIEPYTIDSNGKSVASNVLDRIYTPNNQMSAYDFREALAVMTLVHNKVRIRVHYTGTRINAKSIKGFTFIENAYESIIDGKYQYRLTDGELLTDDEVITLKSINPYNLNEGFSPSAAARRWTMLDDYIADYQSGFFENGAVPAGELIITARTASEFNDIVDMLQEKHKGAGRNNNVTYVHRPTDASGTALNAQIEWVPFSSANKDMALKDLFANVNKKIDSSYGVPASLRAVNDANAYASVRVDEVIFIKYHLGPFALKIWSKFTHELNRITGGLGVALSYELDIPTIADEQLVESQSKQVDATTISTLVTAGYTLDSIVDALDYPVTYKLLKTDGKTPVIENDKPEVLSPEEARGTPDQPIDQFAKAFIQINEHINKQIAAAKVIPEPKTKRIGDIDKQMYIDRMSTVIKEHMGRQLTEAIDDLPNAMKTKAFGDSSKDEDVQFTKEMYELLLPLMSLYGGKQTHEGIALVYEAGLNTQDIAPFEFTGAQKAAYNAYLSKVGVAYADQTAEQIRKILADGITNGLSQGQIENKLKDIILGSDNEYRVTRLARSEVVGGEGRASVYSMQNIAHETGYSIYKVWNNGGPDPCPFCLSLNGSKTLVDSNFIEKNTDVHGTDGSIYHADFTNIESAHLHPNDECYETYEVEAN